MREIVIATRNKGKLREIRDLLSGLAVEIVSLDERIPNNPPIAETGDTFLENAFLKAQWVFSKTGVWTLADDSGLAVDFLGGDPGVRSSRYAGENAKDRDNNEKLLRGLAACPVPGRTARFRCVAVLMIDAEQTITTEGACEGRIGFEPQGSGGFGYDPLFYPDGYDESFASLDEGVKNLISHRGKAMAEMRKRIAELL